MQENFLKNFLPLFFIFSLVSKAFFCETLHPNQLYHLGKFEEAAFQYLRSSDDPESLFYASVCFEKLGQKDEARKIRETIVQQFPRSAFAEEALFFNLLEETHPDLKKLEESPYQAYFLIQQGDKSSLLKCLSLLEKPKNSYFLELKHHTFFALARLEPHVEYGLAYLRQSMREETPPAIEQERDFLFALFYSKTNKKQAVKYIDKSIKKYDNIVKNPYLFKLLKLKGQLLDSIEVLNRAEGAFLPNQTEEEELLDLWLSKAQIFFQEGQEDSALNQLAAIINSPVASIKRVEAMVLRQEVFTKMGRPDLASRHLATVNSLKEELTRCKTGSDF